MQIINLNKVYQEERNGYSVLENISIKFPNKGLVFLSGRSGSGKSTLLRIMAGLDSPTSGEIIYNNNYTENNVGFIFQSYNLIEDLTVLENILLNNVSKGIEFDLIKLDEILGRLNITEIKNQKVNNISIGEKQRVSIARVLYNNCEIIMADEPTGSLDYKSKEIVMNLLKELSKEKLVIVASHDKQLVNEYMDFLVVLENKRIKFNNIVIDSQQTNDFTEIVKNETKLSFVEKMRIYFKISFLHTIKKLRLKTFLGIFISVIILSFLFVVFTVSQFNYKEVALKQMFNDGEYNSTLISKYRFSKKDLNEIKEEYEDAHFYKVTSRYSLNLPFSRGFKYRTPKVLIYEDNSFFDKFDLKLVSGKYPELKDEILITLYHFDLFKKYDLYTNNTEKKITNYDDIINEEIVFAGERELKRVKIVGIIDTNFKLSQYSLADDIDNSINEIVNDTIHTSVMISSKTENYIDDIREFYTEEIYYNFENITDKIIFIKSDYDETLKYDEAIINYKFAKNLGFDIEDIEYYYELHVDKTIMNHAYENFPKIKDKMERDLNNKEWWIYDIVGSDELNYIHYYRYINKYVLYGMPNYYIGSFGNKAINELVDKTYSRILMLEDHKTIEVVFYDKVINLKIKGVYLQNANSTLIISNDLFNEFDYINNTPQYSNIHLYTKNKKTYKKIIYSDLNVKNEYFLQSQYANAGFDGMVDSNPNLITIGTIVLLLILVPFIIRYTISNINYRKKELIILKLQSFNNRQISLIIGIESTLLLIGSFALSSIISAIFTKVLNDKKTSKFYLFDIFYKNNFMSVLIVFGLMITGVLIAIIVPLLILKRKNYSDILRGL